MPSSSPPIDTTIATARSLQPGVALSGSLPTWTDRNLFALSLQAGFSYAVAMTPLTTSIVNITLVDSSGADATSSVLAFGLPSPIQPEPPGTYSSNIASAPPIGQANVPVAVSFTALTTETVFAEVGATYFGGVLVGQAVPATPYTIQLSQPDDFGDTPATAGQLAIGTSVSGNFGVPNDRDQFAVTLEAGETYEFDSPTTKQLSMTLQTADLQHQVAQWNWYEPALTYTPDVTGTYYLTLSTWLDFGHYTISAKLLPQSQTPLTDTTAFPPTATVEIALHRLFNTRDGTHLITASASEADDLLAGRSGWIKEESGIEAVSNQTPGAQPVFRFFNTTNGSQFLTVSTAERDTIMDNRPGLVFEGVGFNAYATAQDQTAPVYRYFDVHDGSHFYTSSTSEIATLGETRPDLRPEGIAFYAPTS